MEKDTNPDTLVYFFTWKTSYACPVTPSHEIEGGLSGGSILLIMYTTINKITEFNSFFTTATVYFAGGLIFLKFVRHAEGVSMVPNVEFWSSLPGLVKVVQVQSCVNSELGWSQVYFRSHYWQNHWTKWVFIYALRRCASFNKHIFSKHACLNTILFV
jgi:hypothetical protein